MTKGANVGKGYCCIGLHQPKTPCNVGATLRAAHAFGADIVFFSGRRYKRHATDTTNAYKELPLIQVNDLHSVVPYDCVPVAVDLLEDAEPLTEYEHPERAFYIFGPEDGTLGKRVTSWCRDKIYIPTKACLNLAATVNVVLYDRQTKYGEQ